MGVNIHIHFTFVIILALFTWIFGFTNQETLGFVLGFGGLSVDWTIKLILGFVASIIFFASVLIHELAHSYVAIRYGYKVSGITLFVFGGVSQIEKAPAEAPGEAWMALVGPGTSFIAGVLLILLWSVSRYLGSGLLIEGAVILFGLTGFYNVLLGAFNLIPAFPMDGGRILRSTLAKRTGFVRATEIAASVGRAFAIALAVFGFFFSIWLLFIALFIYLGAGEEEKGARMEHSLRGINVGKIMTENVSSIPPSMPIDALLSKMLDEKHLGYPVVDGNRVVGVVTLHDAVRVVPEQRGSVTVGDAMTGDMISVTPETEATEAIRIMSTKRIGLLLVLSEGKLRGIVTQNDLMKVLEIMSSISNVGARR